MKRWLIFALAIACLAGGMWVLGRNRPADKGIAVTWKEPAWTTDTFMGSSTPEYWYRAVRIRNEGGRGYANVYLVPEKHLSSSTIQKAAVAVVKSNDIASGHELFMQFRCEKGTKMSLSAVVFDCSTAELAKRIETRKQFPWAQSILPLRYRIVPLSED